MRPVDAGEGDKEVHVFYYNKQEKKCMPFIYKGEGGNRNRFSTMRKCEEKCVKGREKEKPKRKPHTPSSRGMVQTDKGI
ncbi:unnamed protein product [Schistosoma intercalatum]|nr:unnamed protein product [Schistosoma intercalatum]CAH8511862.1 unnamed protein product [Schistosoma intercalatum]